MGRKRASAEQREEAYKRAKQRMYAGYRRDVKDSEIRDTCGIGNPYAEDYGTFDFLDRETRELVVHAIEHEEDLSWFRAGDTSHRPVLLTTIRRIDKFGVERAAYRIDRRKSK